MTRSAGHTGTVLEVLLDRHGRTFATEAGIRVDRNIPSVLFQLLCLSLLISARIRAAVATTATRALISHGWTTASKMADSTWEDRTRVLNAAGYARYDESTSRYLGSTAALVLERYGGDIRELRASAHGSRERLSEGLRECRGIGEVGASFFLREVQGTWQEFAPFMDARARETAIALGLPTDPQDLAELAGDAPFVVVVAALDRAALARDAESILDRAAHG